MHLNPEEPLFYQRPATRLSNAVYMPVFAVESIACWRREAGFLASWRVVVFYAFAFDAKSKMVGQDYYGALLSAVAALESAHGTFVSHALARRLPSDYPRRISANLPEDFIRELGMTNCNRLTPFLLMQQEDRPTTDMIAGCEKGIKYRNEIMHGLKNRRGEYRIVARSDKNIIDGYSAVLRVYECYRRAVESLSDRCP